MKIQAQQIIINPLTQEEVEENGKPLTAGRVAASALLQVQPSSSSPAAIFDAHDLAMRLGNAKADVDISAQEKKMIEDAVSKVYTPLAAAPTLKAIQEDKPGSSKKK